MTTFSTTIGTLPNASRTPVMLVSNSKQMASAQMNARNFSSAMTMEFVGKRLAIIISTWQRRGAVSKRSAYLECRLKSEAESANWYVQIIHTRVKMGPGVYRGAARTIIIWKRMGGATRRRVRRGLSYR